MGTRDRTDAAGRLAAAEAVRRTVAALARPLARRHVPVAPLKGALLVHAWGRDPLERPVSDVDLLVAPHRFDEASRVLEAEGHRLLREERGGRERLFAPAGGGPPVDLHRELFPEGLFALPARTVLGRARPDTEAFGAPVLLLDPLDAFAHLVGHAAHTFLFEHRAHHLADLAFLAGRAGLAPEALTRHLKRTRLDRAARWVLRLDPAVEEGFGRPLLQALGHDPAGDALARAVLAVVPRLPERRGLGLVPSNVLHRDPLVAVRLLGSALGRRALRAVRGPNRVE